MRTRRWLVLVCFGSACFSSQRHTDVWTVQPVNNADVPEKAYDVYFDMYACGPGEELWRGVFVP